MQILKKWLLLSIALLTSVVGFSQESTPGDKDDLSASKVFAELPYEVLDLLRPSTRLDMLDYYNHADSLIVVQDALGGQSRLEEVAPDYLKVSVTPISTLEIKILPYKKGQIIMTLYTVGAESGAKDTVVKFFDSALNPLVADKYLKVPDIKDFFNVKDSEIKESDLKDKIPFETIVYTTGPGDAPLIATLTTLTTLSKEDQELMAHSFTPSLSASWNSKYKFK